LIEGRTWGYWLFTAIYAGKTAPATAAERRSAVNGLVALRINGERLLAESMAARPLSARLRMMPASGAAPFNLATRANAGEHTGYWAATVFTHGSEIGSARVPRGAPAPA
jgi:hypothetical protein